MPVKPGSTTITFMCSAPSASGTLYCNDIRRERVIQDFDRTEFSNERLRNAPTVTGATPLIVQAFGNQPIQLLTTCTDDVPRPLTPDDANIPNIKQRFNIIRYTISGAANTSSDVISLDTIWANHVIRLDAFNLYLATNSMNLSITYLQNTLQPLTFADLTVTGCSLTGNALLGTLSNVLITQLSLGVEYEAALPDGSGNSTVLQDFSCVFEQRSITSAGPMSLDA